jgi:hypothetical protein
MKTIRVKRIINKQGICEIKALDDPREGFIINMVVV